MSNQQDEKTATIRALEEQMRGLVRERDQVKRDIRVREQSVILIDNAFMEKQGHDHRILTRYNGNIKGMDTALSVVHNSIPGYPNSLTGAMGSSGGSSMSNSPAEGTTTNIFSQGRAKQEAPSPQETAGTSGVIPLARLHLGGGTTTAMDYSAGHVFQGGPQGPGAGALGAQAWAPGWQTSQSTGLSTDEVLSGLNQVFQKRAFGAGPSGAGAPGRFLRPD